VVLGELPLRGVPQPNYIGRQGRDSSLRPTRRDLYPIGQILYACYIPDGLPLRLRVWKEGEEKNRKQKLTRKSHFVS
jgi:hypothetical protein